MLDALSLAPVPGQGRSLLAAPGDEPPTVYAEKRNGRRAMRALMTPGGKLLEIKPRGEPGVKPRISGEGQWYYFEDPVGPDREDVLAALPPEQLARQRRLLEATWAASVRLFEQRVGDGATRRKLSDDEIEALRQLGYVE